MMKHISTVAAALVLIAIIQQPLQAAQHTDEGEVQLSQLEHRLVKAVNAHRAKHRLAPLSVDPVLMRVARCLRHHYSHVIDGKWCWHRTRQAGLPVGRPMTSPTVTRPQRTPRKVGPRPTAMRCKCAVTSR